MENAVPDEITKTGREPSCGYHRHSGWKLIVIILAATNAHTHI